MKSQGFIFTVSIVAMCGCAYMAMDTASLVMVEVVFVDRHLIAVGCRAVLVGRVESCAGLPLQVKELEGFVVPPFLVLISHVVVGLVGPMCHIRLIIRSFASAARVGSACILKVSTVVVNRSAGVSLPCNDVVVE